MSSRCFHRQDSIKDTRSGGSETNGKPSTLSRAWERERREKPGSQCYCKAFECFVSHIRLLLLMYIHSSHTHYSRSTLEHQPSKCTLCLVSICVNKTIQRGTHPRRKEWCSTENGGERDTTSNCVCVYTQEGLSSCWYREVCGDKTHFGGNFQNNHIG